jgi:hypothetical protein
VGSDATRLLPPCEQQDKPKSAYTAGASHIRAHPQKANRLKFGRRRAVNCSNGARAIRVPFSFKRIVEDQNGLRATESASFRRRELGLERSTKPIATTNSLHRWREIGNAKQRQRASRNRLVRYQVDVCRIDRDDTVDLSEPRSKFSHRPRALNLQSDGNDALG